MSAPLAVFPVLWSLGLNAPGAEFLGSGAAKAAVLIPVFAAFYILPVLLAQVWRKLLLARGAGALERTLQSLHPLSLLVKPAD